MANRTRGTATSARLAALGSILMWLSVLLAGRWIGSFEPAPEPL